MTPSVIVGLSAISFIAGFIDAIAGGGGLLTVPSLLLSGLSPHLVLGTNKLASCCGTFASVVNYSRKKMVWWRLIALGIAFTFLGSLLGAKAILAVNDKTAKIIMLGLMPVAIGAMLIKKKAGQSSPDELTRPMMFKAILICLAIGFYDGFFGPGAGSFLAIGFYVFLHFDLVKATANAKVFNLISNIGALAMFLSHGQVSFLIGIPMAATNIAGNYVGSHMAIKRGATFIQKILVVVIVFLMGSLVWQLFGEKLVQLCH